MITAYFVHFDRITISRQVYPLSPLATWTSDSDMETVCTSSHRDADHALSIFQPRWEFSDQSPFHALHSSLNARKPRSTGRDSYHLRENRTSFSRRWLPWKEVSIVHQFQARYSLQPFNYSTLVELHGVYILSGHRPPSSPCDTVGNLRGEYSERNR